MENKSNNKRHCEKCQKLDGRWAINTNGTLCPCYCHTNQEARTALLEEVREMLGGMKKVIPKTVNMTPYPDDLIRAFAIEEQGYNKALDELLSRLSEIK